MKQFPPPPIQEAHNAWLRKNKEREEERKIINKDISEYNKMEGGGKETNNERTNVSNWIQVALTSYFFKSVIFFHPLFASSCFNNLPTYFRNTTTSGEKRHYVITMSAVITKANVDLRDNCFSLLFPFWAYSQECKEMKVNGSSSVEKEDVKKKNRSGF